RHLRRGSGFFSTQGPEDRWRRDRRVVAIPDRRRAHSPPVAPAVPRIAERDHDPALFERDRRRPQPPLLDGRGEPRPLCARRAACQRGDGDLTEDNMADDIAFLPATELLKRYRDKSLSPVEVIDTVLARLERFEGAVNAFVLYDPDTARKMARESEARWAKG